MQKGRQRELIMSYLQQNNCSIKDLSKKLQVGIATIYDWLKEKNLIPEEAYNVFDVNLVYSKYIHQKLDDNWGRTKGGFCSSGNTKEIKKIKYSSELAEFLGVLFGDGNSYAKKAKNVGVYAIRIVGDSRNDKEYLIDYVKPLGEKIFGIVGKISYARSRNAIFLTFHSREMVYALKKLGFPPGDKIQNKIFIPVWIKSSKLFLRRFVRGLLDTDGSIFRMSKKDPQLLRIDLTNLIPNLLSDIRKILLNFQFNPSKIICEKHFFLSRKQDIRNYIDKIGFSNPKHINRAIRLAFSDSPVV